MPSRNTNNALPEWIVNSPNRRNNAMPLSVAKRTIAVVSACMTVAGLPDLALNQVEVTPEEVENGIHYCLAEAQLLRDGYEEPFVHFSEEEAPAFLHPAIRHHLGLPPSVTDPTIPSPSEESQCPASSK
jgi:hypothetical protein